jgi:hypothetical protein
MAVIQIAELDRIDVEVFDGSKDRFSLTKPTKIGIVSLNIIDNYRNVLIHHDSLKET